MSKKMTFLHIPQRTKKIIFAHKPYFRRKYFVHKVSPWAYFRVKTVNGLGKIRKSCVGNHKLDLYENLPF
jgi:hypothetical protein